MNDQDTLDDDVRFLFEFLTKEEALAAIQRGRALAHEVFAKLGLRGDAAAVAADLVALRAVGKGSLVVVSAAVNSMRGAGGTT